MKKGSYEINPIGTVIEALPNCMFRLSLSDGKEIIGYLSGKMKKNSIQLGVGDRASVVIDPAGGKTTNRIMRRI